LAASQAFYTTAQGRADNLPHVICTTRGACYGYNIFEKCNLLYAGADVIGALTATDLDQMIGRVNRVDFQEEKAITVLSASFVTSYDALKLQLR
jgi:hypothetical protein